MSTSIQPTAKAELVTILRARPNLSAVEVSYGHPGPKAPPKECIYIGDINGSQEARVLGNSSRQETFTLETVVWCLQPGDDQQSVTERTYTLMAEIEDAVRADPTLSGVVNFDTQVTGPIDLKEFFTPEGREAQLTFVIQCRGKI